MELTAAIETRLIKSPKLPLRESVEVEEMISSIRERGLIQPIVVRLIEDHFEVVAGATRFLACKKLRWKSIPCLVRELSDTDAFEISLTENIQRKVMDPIEEARAFKKYIEDNGRGSEGRLAKVIGKSQEYISHRLSLLQLPASVKEEVIRGRIKPSTAQELATLRDEELQKSLSEQITGMNLRAIEVRRRVRSLNATLSSDLIPDPNLDHNLLEEISQPDFVREFHSDLSFTDSETTKVLLKSITVVRIALVKLGSLIDDLSEDDEIYGLLVEKRLELHSILDSLIRSKIRLKDLAPKYKTNFNPIASNPNSAFSRRPISD